MFHDRAAEEAFVDGIVSDEFAVAAGARLMPTVLPRGLPPRVPSLSELGSFTAAPECLGDSVMKVAVPPFAFNKSAGKGASYSGSAEPEGVGSFSHDRLFLGSVRFELTREGIQWILKTVTGILIDLRSITIQVRANVPNGSVKLFVESKDSADILKWNHRIYCGAHFLYFGDEEDMRRRLDSLIEEDSDKGRRKGPAHLMVVERGNASSLTGSFASNPFLRISPQSSPSPSFAGLPPQLSSESLTNGSFTFVSHASAASSSPPPSMPASGQATACPVSTPPFYEYPSVAVRSPSPSLPPPPPLKQAAQVFVGGLAFEADATFISWMLNTSCPGHAPIHPDRVAFMPSGHAGPRRGCAIVTVEFEQASALFALNKRIFCTPTGFHLARSREVMDAFIAEQVELSRRTGEKRAGPSHAVVLEPPMSKQHHPRTPPPLPTSHHQQQHPQAGPRGLMPSLAFMQYAQPFMPPIPFMAPRQPAAAAPSFVPMLFPSVPWGL